MIQHLRIDYGRMEEKKASRKKRSRRRGRRRKKQKVVIEETWPSDEVGLTILKFSACTQCGYFLTSYRATVGLEQLKSAVEQSEHNWLDLGWHENMPTMLHHAYELATDGTPDFLEHCCPECHRVISIQPIDSINSIDQVEPVSKSNDRTNKPNLAIQIMPD